MSEAIEIGMTYGATFPFCLEEVELLPDDPEATQMAKVKSWRPGVRFELSGYCDTDTVADGIGQILLTVVDVHKPGHYPTRVFYTRQWKDPAGKAFGKGGLRIATQAAFRRLCRGYRHDFELAEAAP